VSETREPSSHLGNCVKFNNRTVLTAMTVKLFTFSGSVWISSFILFYLYVHSLVLVLIFFLVMERLLSMLRVVLSGSLEIYENARTYHSNLCVMGQWSVL
jgi:hypothetical protein